MTGPTWKGLYMSKVKLKSQETVIANDAYLTESITDPSAKTVAGYPEGVMAAAIKPGSVSQADVRALIAYIRTLR